MQPALISGGRRTAHGSPIRRDQILESRGGPKGNESRFRTRVDEMSAAVPRAGRDVRGEAPRRYLLQRSLLWMSGLSRSDAGKTVMPGPILGCSWEDARELRCAQSAGTHAAPP